MTMTPPTREGEEERAHEDGLPLGRHHTWCDKRQRSPLLQCSCGVSGSASSPSRAVEGGGEEELTEAQLANGVTQARRIIRESAGYYLGGALVPFGEEFKSLALKAIARLSHSSTPSSSTAGGSDISDSRHPETPSKPPRHPDE